MIYLRLIINLDEVLVSILPNRMNFKNILTKIYFQGSLKNRTQAFCSDRKKFMRLGISTGAVGKVWYYLMALNIHLV